jgi:signal transduction histidine kinase
VPALDRRIEWAVALVPLGLTALTVLLLVSPQIAPAIVSERLQLLINATATLVAAAVAILAWVHFREGGDAAALVRASAFLVLASINGLMALVSAAGIARAFGLAIDAPGQLPAWATLIAGGTAAVLFVAAGITALHTSQADRWPAALVLWLPSLSVVGFVVLAATGQPQLPVIIDPRGLAILREHPAQPLLAAAGPIHVGLQAAIGVAYLLAAGLAYAVFRRGRRGVDALLAIGLVVAAFSQVQFAVHPGTYGSLVTAGDLLRMTFYGVLLVALAVDTRRDVRDLHDANAELVRLRDAAATQATADERARLAREIHDGMSQELWLAKLKQGRLLQTPDLGPEATALATEVSGAIEAALAEARQAILALRPTEGGTFTQVLERYVDDFSDRFGVRAECQCDPVVERLGPRAQAELLRIVQEALANSRKHADATRVRVDAEPMPHGVRLTIADNGRGFVPDTKQTTGYGLRSMRERAGLIGASLTIDSQPRDGTRVVVDVPFLGATT